MSDFQRGDLVRIASYDLYPELIGMTGEVRTGASEYANPRIGNRVALDITLSDPRHRYHKEYQGCDDPLTVCLSDEELELLAPT